MKLRLLPTLVLLAALIPAFAYFWEFRDIPHLGNLQDDAVYLNCGKAIATGQGYRLLFLPGHPLQIKYPPVYPLVVAAVWRWFPDFPSNTTKIAMVNLPAFAVVVFAAFALYRRFGIGQPAALALAASLAWIPAYLYLMTSVMTETIFIALFLSMFVALEKSSDEDNWKWAAVGGSLAAIGYLTRTAASPLFLTVPACFVLRRQFRHAAAFLATGAPFVAGWQLWGWLHPFKPYDWVTRFYLGYGEMERMTVGLDNVGQVVYQNIDAILSSIGEIFVFGIADSWLGHQAARLIAVAALSGIVRLVGRSRKYQYGAFAGVFVSLMIFWHYPPDQRLFAPLTPLFVAGLFTELHHLWTMAQATRRSKKQADRTVAVVFAGLVCAFGLYVVYSAVHTRFVELPQVEMQARADTAKQREAFLEVGRRTPEGATILTDQDALLGLYTGRTAYRTIVAPRLFYPMNVDRVRSEFAAMPDQAHAPWDYVFITRCDWRHTLSGEDRELLRKSIASRPDLEAVWRTDQDALYVRRQAASADGHQRPVETAFRPEREPARP